MKKQFDEKEIQEVHEHVSCFVEAIAFIQREFLQAIDPSESPETLDYVRRVAYAIDNVVLTLLQSENNDERRKLIQQSSEIMIQNIIDYHNDKEEKH